jgi:hypothetical protein
MNAQEQANAAQRVAYLWGAGATQAEIAYTGAHSINLLMRDNDDFGVGVATRILNRLPQETRSAFESDKGVDIEKLISLLIACNVDSENRLADQIRRYYFEDIRDGLSTAGILSNPKLALGLLELHKQELFRQIETLSGIITTNHDGLLQLAGEKVYGGVDIGIPFESDEVTPINGVFSLVQLHGSFTWTFGVPARVHLLKAETDYDEDTVWIPPAILKDSRSYPFNKLLGHAYELLSKHCDILRVVGSSLTQNDWHILSLVFGAQRHRELSGGTPFRIELIMPTAAGESIVEACSYLRNLTPIGQLTDGDFTPYLDEAILNDDMKNPLFYWLREKIQFHLHNGHLGHGDLPASMADIVGGLA